MIIGRVESTAADFVADDLMIVGRLGGTSGTVLALMLPLVTALAGGPSPDSADGPPRPKTEKKVARGMMIGGAALFGVSYGASTVASAVTLDDSPNRNQFRWAMSMAVPVVGPFRAAALPQSTGDRVATVATGLMQAGGVALIVGGAVAAARHGRADRWARAHGRPVPGPRPNYGKLFGISGGITLASYIVTLSIGASRASDARQSPDKFDDPQRVGAFGRRLTIPFVGGFLAMPKARTYVGAWGAGVASMVQIAGLSTAIVAATLDRPAHRRRTTLSATPTRDGAQVTMTMRF